MFTRNWLGYLVCLFFKLFNFFFLPWWFLLLLMWGYQFNSVAQSCTTLCNPMDCSTPGSLSITNSWSLLKLKFIESVMPYNHLIFCIPLLLPSIFLKIRVFSKESVLCIRWPKYWSLSLNISPSNEYSGLISFRIDWLDLLAVQRTLKSLLQYHNSKASILRCLALWSNFHIHTQLLEKP